MQRNGSNSDTTDATLNDDSYYNHANDRHYNEYNEYTLSTNNLSPHLQQLVYGKVNNNYDSDSKWIPPSEPGLHNSERIIQLKDKDILYAEDKDCDHHHDTFNDDHTDDESDYKLCTDNVSSDLKSLMYGGDKDSSNDVISRNNSHENDMNTADDKEWHAPSKSGLMNSDVILPSYYQSRNSSKIIDIEYFEVIKDDVRNFRKLNKYQTDYVFNDLDETLKNELMKILLDVNNNLIELHDPMN